MTYFRTFRLAIVACLAACTFPGVAILHADDEWEQYSDYYEDDAWYDVSEWFDGNDYNPTDESFGVWDDETYDRYSDTGEDYDNDWDGDIDDGYSFNDDLGYDYDDPYVYDSQDYYSDAYDGYDYDYDFDDPYSYDTGDYLNDTNDWYGYDGVYDNDDWFYDYYDEGYSHYSDWDNDGVYDYAYRYYAYDNDGLYDAYTSYSDWDDDGQFDDYNYYSFNEVGSSEKNSRQSQQQASRNAKRHNITGDVISTKKVSVQDTKNLLVRLRNRSGDKECFVDLGPVSELDDFDISEGDQITVRGPLAKVGGKKLLIAQRLKANSNSTKIDRDRRQFKGQIADTRTIAVRDRQHQMVMLRTGSNKQRLVDLGPSDELDLDLSEGDRVTVSGPVAKVNDRQLVFAQTLSHDGEQVEIERREQRQSRQSRQSGRDRSSDQASR